MPWPVLPGSTEHGADGGVAVTRCWLHERDSVTGRHQREHDDGADGFKFAEKGVRNAAYVCKRDGCMTTRAKVCDDVYHHVTCLDGRELNRTTITPLLLLE